MCPLKREQATRVSYNTLTHSRLYCRDREKKVGHELSLDFDRSFVHNRVLIYSTDGTKFNVYGSRGWEFEE